MTNPVDALKRSIGSTGELIDQIKESQWEAPTPCAQWGLGELVNHLVGSLNAFAAAFDAPPAQPPGSTAEAYRDAAERVMGAFTKPGALERQVRVPMGMVPAPMALQLLMVEVIVHGWDIARATGQSAAFDETDVESAIAFSEAALAQIPPERKPFDAPRPVPADAVAVDRLAGLLGRAVVEGD